MLPQIIAVMQCYDPSVMHASLYEPLHSYTVVEVE